MADVIRATEQQRHKRALQKENSLGTRNLEAAVHWSSEFLQGADWHSELKHLQPTIIKVVQHGCSQLPKKLTDEPLLLHSVVAHRKVIAYRAPAFAAAASLDGPGGAVGSSAGSSAGSAAAGAPKIHRGSGSAATAADSSCAAGQYQRQASDEQQRFSIPLAYEGWFEILSEDGQAALPFSRVAQLADASPRAFLVREKCKAYYYSDASSSVAGREPAPDKSRSVHAGELMAVVGATTAVLGWRHRRKRSLHCLDESGAAVYFDCDQRGSFSPVAPASGADVVGVHRISAIAEAFRMPITVRSVGGLRARAGAAGPGAPGCFRLAEVRTDEVALLLPLRTGGSLVPVSARTHLRVVAADNRDELVSRDDFAALNRSCSTKAEAYFKTIQVLVSTDHRQQGGASAACGRSSVGASASDDRPMSSGSDRYLRSFSHEEDYVPPPPRLPLPPTPSHHQRSSPSSICDDDDDDEKNGSGAEQPSGETGSCGSGPTSEENLLFEEVDDLYDYVRRGGEPPKPRPRSWANQGTVATAGGADDSSGGGSSSGGRRPQPAPESRRLDDDGRSSSQPILSSNGVLRGRLAELTSGRFPRHASRSTPAVAVTGLVAMAQPADTPAADNAAAAVADISGVASGPGGCTLLEPPRLSPWASAALDDSSNAGAAVINGRGRRSSVGGFASERDYANDCDDGQSLPTSGGTGSAGSLASAAGSIASTHSQAHLSSVPDLAGGGSDDSTLAMGATEAAAHGGAAIFLSTSAMLPRLLLSTSAEADDELRVGSQQQHPPRCSPLLVVVTSDGDSDSTAISDDIPAARALSSLSSTAAAAASSTAERGSEGAETLHNVSAAFATSSPSDWRGSACSTPESGTAFWSCRSSPPPQPQLRSMETLCVPLPAPAQRGFDTIRAEGRRCASGASSPLTLIERQRPRNFEPSSMVAGGHDGRYATLSYPAASAASRQHSRMSVAPGPCRSTGDLVRLFEQLTVGSPTATGVGDGLAATGSRRGSSGALASMLTFRRGSRSAMRSEGKPPTDTPPSEPEGFETGNTKTVSDSIRRRITTLKLSAHALMV